MGCIVAVIQARMGSTRLPGKVAFPLGNARVIQHDIRRAQSASEVDSVVVATSTKRRDDLVARLAQPEGVTVYRGDEDDVLGRVKNAAEQADADIVLRLTGDNTLVPIELMNVICERVSSGVAHATNKVERTFPLGMDADGFTLECLSAASRAATEPYQREHVTPYVRENPEQFEIENIDASDVYEDNGSLFADANDLCVTLDNPDDYELLQRVYEGIEFDVVLPAYAAIEYIESYELADMNDSVKTKTHHW